MKQKTLYNQIKANYEFFQTLTSKKLRTYMARLQEEIIYKYIQNKKHKDVSKFCIYYEDI